MVAPVRPGPPKVPHPLLRFRLAARALNPELYILSRAGQPESIRRLELASADRAITPYGMAGRRMAAHGPQVRVLRPGSLWVRSLGPRSSYLKPIAPDR